jgi:MmyB-like transcription regulator ligand binding domain
VVIACRRRAAARAGATARGSRRPGRCEHPLVRAPGEGTHRRVSDDVLDAVARALQLDEAERTHLFNLARAAKPTRTPRRRTKAQTRPSLLRIPDSMTNTAAFIRNSRLDILAINPLGRTLYAPVFDDPTRPANLAWMMAPQPGHSSSVELTTTADGFTGVTVSTADLSAAETLS